MGGNIDHQAVWALVRAQNNAISRIQLLQFGFTRHAIQHRVDRGRLVPEWPGVYRVGRRPLDRLGRFMAAVLACGDGAILSHQSAANVWGIRKGGLDPIDISIPAHRRIRLEGIRIHRRNPMPPATTKGALPLCSPLFTLVDLAASLDTDPLEAAINDADRLGLIDPEALEAGVDAIPAFRGRAKLRKILVRYTRTDSNLERAFLKLAELAGMPPPRTQADVEGFRVDFFWPELDLVVETDGLTYHRTPPQQAADRKRDQMLVAAGLRCVRFPNAQIRDTPGEVIRILERLAQQRQERLFVDDLRA